MHPEKATFLCRTIRSVIARFEKSKTGGHLSLKFCSTIRTGLNVKQDTLSNFRYFRVIVHLKSTFATKFTSQEFRSTCSLYFVLNSTLHQIYVEQRRQW